MNQVDEIARSAPFNLAHVRSKLEELFELDSSDELAVRLLAGGRSNLTFELASPNRKWILRRPPIGHRLETAHDMQREVAVQRALANSPVPVPRIVYADDAAPDAGGSFYIMDKIDGEVLRTDSDFSEVEPTQRAALSYRYIDCLSALHTRDYDSLGLTTFGRPAGFLERQVRRWRKQLAASKSRELPVLEELGRRLGERLPQHSEASIVHGDFRFDNMIARIGEQPTIAAVLDWEMSTLGDPLTDLGLVHLFWSGWEGITNPIAGTPSTHPGYPSFDDLVERYARTTGFDVSELSWYSSFAFYKMAVILEGIHLRFVNGETVGDGFDNIGSMVQPLAERGFAALP
ncbi:phosphotransferase family protein [Rhodococcus koreensis]|uniref:phosphotransferase family protein n=1 Tax=Rhodococcus koreensis TaxID=99653 RepID=UPI001980C523|nr:phosphotransferase family protein [Rhodococcus koreensis]QSE86767.1 phosphotransferase family protein [Rhodococcus koreensis]